MPALLVDEGDDGNVLDLVAQGGHGDWGREPFGVTKISSPVYNVDAVDRVRHPAGVVSFDQKHAVDFSLRAAVDEGDSPNYRLPAGVPGEIGLRVIRGRVAEKGHVVV